MRKSLVVFLLVFCFGMLSLSISKAETVSNLALGKAVYTLPVASPDKTFYKSITDGDKKTFAKFGGWSKYCLIVLDLGKADFFDEVRIHSNTIKDYNGSWGNLKPHFALYIGRNVDELNFCSEVRHSENFDVSLADANKPYLSFGNLNAFGRYVVIYSAWAWGGNLYEIEVLKEEKKERNEAKPSIVTVSLEEIWNKDVSLSSWFPMSTEVVTPHIKWAKPASVGQVKALYFSHKGQFRDIAELNQRMDLDWEWVPIILNSTVDKPEVSPINIVEERIIIEKLARDYDVIILGASVRWADLPEKVRELILAKVEKGTGLIYVNPLEECLLPDIGEPLSGMYNVKKSNTSLINNFNLEKVSYMAPLREDLLSLGKHGLGTIALLKYDNLLVKSKLNFGGSALLPEFFPYSMIPSPAENFFAFFTNLIYHVTNKKAAIQITDLLIHNQMLEVRVNGQMIENKLAGLSIGLELRDKNYDICDEFSSYLDSSKKESVIVAQGEEGLTVQIPLQKVFSTIRKGDNFINIWIRNAKGEVLDFGVTNILSSSAGIKTVIVQKDGYKRESDAKFEVELDTANPNNVLEMKAVDGFQRIIWSATSAIDSERAKLSIDLSDSKSYAVNLIVNLKRNGVLVDSVKEVLACGVGDFDSSYENYTFDVWGEAPWKFSQPWMIYALKQQRDAGVDSTLAYANYYASESIADEEWDKILDSFLSTFALQGLRPQFQYSSGVSNYMARNINNRLWKPANEEISHMILGDPIFLNQYIENVASNVNVGEKWGVTTYSSGDEQQGWMSYHPENINAFRKFIKEKYQNDLALLNFNWGSDYSSFDDVIPVELGNISEALSRAEIEEANKELERKELDEEVLKFKGDEIYTFAPWLEYRLFMDRLFGDVHGVTLRALQAKNPNIRFGLDGTRYAGMIGFNFPEILKEINYIVCYNSPVQAEVIRSYSNKETQAASFVGGYDTQNRDELWAYQGAWLDLIRGLNGVNYYSASGYRSDKTQPYHRYGLIAEDLTLSYPGKIFAQEIGEIKKGIGKLIINSNQSTYKAAIRYSQPSLALDDYIYSKRNQFLSNGYLFSPRTIYELEAAERILIDLGIDWRYITDDEIETGLLAKQPIELLVIPYGVCVSEGEIAELKKFLSTGGIIFATGEFGFLNNQGLVHAKDFSKELFGITTPFPQWFKAKMRGRSIINTLEIENDDWDLPVAFEELEIGGAKAIKNYSNSLPAVIVKEHGKGKAIYLNSYLSNYLSYLPDPLPGPYHNPLGRRESIARNYRDLFRISIGELESLRAINLMSSFYPEENAPYFRIGKFHNGDGTVFYGLIQNTFRRDYYMPYTSKMRKGYGIDYMLMFDNKGHIYDVREKKYLGYGDRIETNIYPCEAKVYAITPYQITGVALDAPKTIERGSDFVLDVSVKLKDLLGDEKIRTNINFEFCNPQGKEVNFYSQNLLLDSLKGQTIARFALSDEPGIWRIKVTETITGVSDYKFLELK